METIFYDALHSLSAWGWMAVFTAYKWRGMHIFWVIKRTVGRHSQEENARHLGFAKTSSLKWWNENISMCWWEMRGHLQWQGLRGKTCIIQRRKTQILEPVMPPWSVLHSLLILQSADSGYGNSTESRILSCTCFQINTETIPARCWHISLLQMENFMIVLDISFFGPRHAEKQTPWTLNRLCRGKQYQAIHLYPLSVDRIGSYSDETMMSYSKRLHLYFLNKLLRAALAEAVTSAWISDRRTMSALSGEQNLCLSPMLIKFIQALCMALKMDAKSIHQTQMDYVLWVMPSFLLQEVQKCERLLVSLGLNKHR